RVRFRVPVAAEKRFRFATVRTVPDEVRTTFSAWSNRTVATVAPNTRSRDAPVIKDRIADLSRLTLSRFHGVTQALHAERFSIRAQSPNRMANLATCASVLASK